MKITKEMYNAEKVQDLKKWGVISLILVSFIGGILLLRTNEKKFIKYIVNYKEQPNNTKKVVCTLASVTAVCLCVLSSVTAVEVKTYNDVQHMLDNYDNFNHTEIENAIVSLSGFYNTHDLYETNNALYSWRRTDHNLSKWMFLRSDKEQIEKYIKYIDTDKYPDFIPLKNDYLLWKQMDESLTNEALVWNAEQLSDYLVSNSSDVKSYIKTMITECNTSGIYENIDIGDYYSQIPYLIYNNKSMASDGESYVNLCFDDDSNLVLDCKLPDYGDSSSYHTCVMNEFSKNYNHFAARYDNESLVFNDLVYNLSTNILWAYAHIVYFENGVAIDSQSIHFKVNL